MLSKMSLKINNILYSNNITKPYSVKQIENVSKSVEIIILYLSQILSSNTYRIETLDK